MTEVTRALATSNRRARPAAAINAVLQVEAEPNPAKVNQDIQISGRLMSEGVGIEGRPVWLANLVDKQIVATAVTDGDGRVSFLVGERPGTYELALFFPGDVTYTPAATPITVLVTDAAQLTATADATTVRPGQRVTITGRLVDVGDAPIAGAELTLTTDPRAEPTATTLTRADGTYTMTFTVPADLLEWGPEYQPNWPEYYVAITWDLGHDNDVDAQAFVGFTADTNNATAEPSGSTVASEPAESTPPASGGLAGTGSPAGVGWLVGLGALAVVAGLILLLRRRR